MKIMPEKSSKDNKNEELEVKGYIGGCSSDCHVYYANSSSKDGCGWDWTAYRNIFA